MKLTIFANVHIHNMTAKDDSSFHGYLVFLTIIHGIHIHINFASNASAPHFMKIVSLSLYQLEARLEEWNGSPGGVRDRAPNGANNH